MQKDYIGHRISFKAKVYLTWWGLFKGLNVFLQGI